MSRRLGSHRRTQDKRRRRWFAAGLVIAALTAVLTNAPALHLLGSEPVRVFPAEHRGTPLAAVFLSGDMGFNFGLSGKVAGALAARGLPVIGVVTPVAFAQHRSAQEAQAIVERALTTAIATTGAQHVILIGESYGADIVATVAPRLPPEQRAHLAAVTLIVPEKDVYFRADPSGLAYLGKPDAQPAPALRLLHAPPLVCIHGLEETESLCPALRGTSARVIGLPGGHYLQHNPARLIATVTTAIDAIVPEARLASSPPAT